MNQLKVRPAKPLVPVVALMLLAFVLRAATFGHPNADADETFYLQVGRMMHDGALPYVDVWDRKPLGLFIIYWAITGLSHSVMAYQIAATLFAGGTAAIIARIGSRLAGGQAGLLAGAAYLGMLAPFLGYGGQAPVFYNLFVAAAAMFVFESLPSLDRGEMSSRIYIAMALGGIAITVKQTALFESAFFGVVVVARLWRAKVAFSRVLRIGAFCALAGAAPTLAISGYYFAAGHWHEYWHAMVLSNLAKEISSPITMAARMVYNFVRLDALLAMAVIGLAVPSSNARPFKDRSFVLGWLLVALCGFLAVPNFYRHYLIPLLVPLTVAAAPFFSRRVLGPIGIVVIAVLSWRWFFPFNFDHTRAAQFSMNSLVRSVEDHSAGRGLFVFDGPVLLYSMTGNRPPSALVMPNHTNYEIENNVSHLKTLPEVIRIIGNNPGAVVTTAIVRNNPANWQTRRIVFNYVNKYCRVVDSQNAFEMQSSALIVVYGDCRRVRNQPKKPISVTLCTFRHHRAPALPGAGDDRGRGLEPSRSGAAALSYIAPVWQVVRSAGSRCHARGAADSVTCHPSQ